MSANESDNETEVEMLRRQLAEAEARLRARGDRNVTASGDMSDNIIVPGDGNTLLGSVETVRIASAVFQMPPEPGQVAPKQLLWTYLNQVITDTGTLDLSGVDRRAVGEQAETRLELAAVYTALDTVRSVDFTTGQPLVKRLGQR